jgi:hypothetical protein
MSEVSPETEAFVSEIIDRIHDYRKEYLYQGLYVSARDLESYLSRQQDVDHHNLDQIISRAMNQQPDWVIEWHQSRNLPDGFAQSAADQKVDLIDFDDPAINHEPVLLPGQDMYDECIRAYWQILCGEKGVRGATHLVRGENNRELAKNIALLLLGTLGASLSWTPFVAAFACIVAYEGLDRICSDNY